jgi:hypothetical protein
MKKSILIIFLFFIYSCGYTSIYNNLEKQDLKIFIVEKKGDRVMNNLIQNEINLYSNKNSVEIFNITVDTKYEKIALTKDSTGAVTDYTISTNSRFLIKYNEKSKSITLNETVNIKNRTDTFEQDLYEENIKRNFASSIREKLISEMLTLR